MVLIDWFMNAIDSRRRALKGEEKGAKAFTDQLVFAKSQPLTLGVEMELALLAPDTLKPLHIGQEIVAAANAPSIKKELFEHMVEATTGVCADAREAERQLAEALKRVLELAQEKGAFVTGSGQPPTISQAEYHKVQDPRYDYIHDKRRVLSERFGTLGMHIHIGIESAARCIAYHNFFMHFVPHLIAITASSPIQNGADTGLASIRPSISESLPVAGMPYNFDSWNDYVALCQAMFRADSIRNLKDLWWDLRPSPRYGTLEIRVCDQPTNLAEAMAAISFVHVLAKWFDQHQSWLDEMPRPSLWRLRENKWRAMRYGLDAQLVVNNQGDTRPVKEDLALWLERLDANYTEMQYLPYAETLKDMMARGNSAARQQRMLSEDVGMDAIACHLVRELKEGQPIWE